ncbi:MAG: hypothetical protein IJ593_11005 [Lachnospiraceae bacterium]|nr:hypothetical protein [Lachnospiraceae bacterium]
MDRGERRRLTRLKALKRKKMASDFGFQGGTVYDKHVEKIKKSDGYMRDGNVRHYISVKHTIKTNNKNKEYGVKCNYSKRDKNRIDEINKQLDELYGINE